jgi:hypothetical protein
MALGAGAVVIAFSGSIGWAIAAAIVGAIIAGGVVFWLSSAANQAEQMDRNFKAATGTLVLSVRTQTDAKRSEAEAILRGAGGSDVRFV